MYSKIDLRTSYPLMRVEEVDTPNTALEMRYGHFDFTVMPFRFNECASDIQGSQV